MNKYLRIIISFLFLCAINNLKAQKRFDCTVYLKENLQSQKLVGELSAVSDSGVVVRNSKGETTLSWKDIYRIRFRKHNGFVRTALPVILTVSAAVAVAFEINNSQHYPAPATSIGRIAINVISTAIPGIIIYFTTRSKSIKINSYQDFKDFTVKAQNYLAK